MKRIALVLAAALIAATAVSAQGVAAPAASNVQATVTKATGKLELVQGVIGLKSGSKTYLVPNLQRVAGFIKGVEEGGTVTVEGYESSVPFATDVVLLHVTKLTVGGKDYDLGQLGLGAGRAMGRGMMQDRMGGARGGRMGGGMMGGRW
jgi:hypothetical protein